MDIKTQIVPSRLTIEKIWDIRQGKEINAYDLLKKPEGEVIGLRRSLQEAISTNNPLLVCPYCHQMVKLSGRRTERGQVSYFSHLYDSDACYIKTTTGLTKEQIEASKYGLIAESDRHKRLKAFIAESLNTNTSHNKGVRDVQVEKRINSTLPYMRWRRPDVQASYLDYKLVFELQLSTTFISTIVDRDIFYRLNNHFIIWVFNFEDNQEFVNLENLMIKDIYYANKRNVFILDSEAQFESKRRGELVLKCNWLDSDNSWHFSPIKNNSDGILVTLDQLHFDAENSKPYYYDADSDYFSRNPSALIERKKWEFDREEIIRALIEKEAKENDLYEGQDESKREMVRQEMARSGECAQRYTKKGKHGLSYKGVILVPAIYTSISSYNEFGYSIIEKNNHLGLVD